MELLTTRKGQTKIQYEGYLYNKSKQLANGFVSYECEKRQKSKNAPNQCKARIKVRGNEVIKGVIHTHAPEPGRAEMLKTRSAIRRRAEETMETPQQIIAANVVSLSQGNNLYFLIFY